VPRRFEELAAISRALDKLSKPAINLDGILRELAADAAAIVGASGIAIALTEGNKTICRASHGSAGPELGAVIDVNSGITGECLRTAVSVVCNDAETAPSINASVCRDLGVRSVVVIPLVARGDVLGVLEAFSPEQNAFSEAHVATLRRLSGLVTCVCVFARAQGTAPRFSTPAYTPPLPPTLPSWSDEHQPEQGRLYRRYVLGAVLALFVLGWAGWRILKTPKYGNPSDAPIASPAANAGIHPSASADAVVSLRSRAEQGEPDAQFALASAYAEGDGVEQNYQEAAGWFSKAAEQGHVPAQSVLGVLYATGRGVPQNYRTAYFWATLAVRSGDQLGKDQVAMLTPHLTRDEITEAERQASTWSKAHGKAGQTAKSARKGR